MKITIPQTADLVRTIAATYTNRFIIPTDPDDAALLIEAWRDALAGITVEQARAAFGRWRTRESWPPAPADLVKLSTNETAANAARASLPPAPAGRYLSGAEARAVIADQREKNRSRSTAEICAELGIDGPGAHLRRARRATRPRPQPQPRPRRDLDE